MSAWSATSNKASSNAAQRLSTSWTTQQDARIAQLEARIKVLEPELALTKTRLASVQKECAEMHENANSANAMLWNVARHILATKDVYGREIVRLPDVAQALANVSHGRFTLDTKKLGMGPVVARLPDFRHCPKTQVVSDTDASQQILINLYQHQDLPVILPALFAWMQKQPFNVWENHARLVGDELSPHVIPVLAHIIMEYAGCEMSK